MRIYPASARHARLRVNQHERRRTVGSDDYSIPFFRFEHPVECQYSGCYGNPDPEPFTYVHDDRTVAVYCSKACAQAALRREDWLKRN